MVFSLFIVWYVCIPVIMIVCVFFNWVRVVDVLHDELASVVLLCFERSSRFYVFGRLLTILMTGVVFWRFSNLETIDVLMI